jgi:cytochrome c oxidase cbb3-type subunit 2
MNARIVAPLAAVFLFPLALIAFANPDLLPFQQPSAQHATNTSVTAVVRTNLGELKWVRTEATDFTPEQKAGRAIFLREGCWNCHSEKVREENGDTRRGAPVREPGEFAFDTPHFKGTSRIGPDLTQVGLKYGDEWHYAHFWNPRQLSADSIMETFQSLFDAPPDAVKIVADGAGNRTLEKTPATEKFFDFSSREQIRLTPNINGLLFVPLQAQGKAPIIWTPNKEYSGDTVRLAAETKKLASLVAYVQKLGTNRGKWRDLFNPLQLEATDANNWAARGGRQVPALPSLPRSPEWVAYGKEVYERRCIGCHGEKGDGNGPAATFMYKQRPRNFTMGEFKFRLTKGPLPSDADLLRTITRGVRGTAMPPWYDLPLSDRLAVIQYIKYELAVDRSDPAHPVAWFVEEPPGPAMTIPPAPIPSREFVAHGKEIWEKASCWECHGHSGAGDGEKARGLKDDFGFPIRPANLAAGQFKSGGSVEDVFRTITTGLAGTPMPSFRDSFPDQDRWAMAYYVLSLSAYKDPITGKPLPISEADRMALNDPTLPAASPITAYIPRGDTRAGYEGSPDRASPPENQRAPRPESAEALVSSTK